MKLKNLFLVSFALLFILLAGCTNNQPQNNNNSTTYPSTQQNNNSGNNSTNNGSSTEVPSNAICSNGNYFAEKLGGMGLIELGLESKKKLKEDIKVNGNSALQGISDLTCLQSLDFEYGTTDRSFMKNISDISALSSLTNLVRLHLSDSRVSDITPLKNAKDLVLLNLDNTLVSDISVVSNFPKLDTINMTNTPVSDVSALLGLKKLGIIGLSGTNVSADDCKALEDNFPDALVVACPQSYYDKYH